MVKHISTKYTLWKHIFFSMSLQGFRTCQSVTRFCRSEHRWINIFGTMCYIIHGRYEVNCSLCNMTGTLNPDYIYIHIYHIYHDISFLKSLCKVGDTWSSLEAMSWCQLICHLNQQGREGMAIVIFNLRCSVKPLDTSLFVVWTFSS